MNKVEYETEGVIFNIQRYSLHDGPGIRTITFLKAARCPANGVVILNHNVTAQSYYLKRMIASAVENVLMLAHNRLFPLLMPGLSIATAVFSVGNVLRFALPVRWK